jgi:hypothetical protein
MTESRTKKFTSMLDSPKMSVTIPGVMSSDNLEIPFNYYCKLPTSDLTKIKQLVSEIKAYHLAP